MSLDISDGFDFTIGQYLAELTIGLIGGAIILCVGAIAIIGFSIYEYIDNRRFRK